MRPLSLVPLLLAADQGVKFYIRSHLHPGWSIKLIPGVIDLTYLRNPGAAFGFFYGRADLLVLVGIIAITAVLVYYRTLPSGKRLLRYGLVLGLTGTLGNLLDRIFYGYVVDMFNLAFWPGIFNLADVAIVSGVILISIELWRDAKPAEKDVN